jgi:predicted amidohydrolase YtcJ
MYKLFYNAKIHTLSNSIPFCNAILTLYDRIIYTGKYSDINLPEYEVEKIDLQGEHVFPGFIDCHTHLAAFALSLERIRFDECKSLAQALDKVNRRVKDYPKGSWILGTGWNANIWRDGQPHKKYLDDISNVHAMAFYNKDGHTQWLNSLALDKCEFVYRYDDLPGGKLGRDNQGILNGLVYEKACEVVDRFSEQVSYEQLERCLDKTYPKIHSMGITSVHSCEGLDKFKLFQQLALNYKLKLRICMHPPASETTNMIDAGLYSGYGNEWLRMGGMKYFVDGSLGSQTAEMFEPFDNLNHCGVAVISEQSLTDQIQYAATHGLSATVHAIGDKANNKALNAFEKIVKVEAPVSLRHRIEHCQILNVSDISRFKKLNIIASMQPIHIADDIELANLYLGERSSLTYAIASILKTGCRIVFGSDMPVADPDPIKGILAAYSRRYNLDADNPSWYPEQSITPYQALCAYTRDAAFASYEENLKGTLEPGKLADFVIISHNISEEDEATVRKAKVNMTVQGGRIVYCSDTISV